MTERFALIKHSHYPLSDLEKQSGLSSDAIILGYPYGDLRRYGAKGDGATNDRSAILAAVNSGHRVLGGGSEYIYRNDSVITLTKSLDFDGQGCTMRPNGNTALFSINAPTITATTTVSSGATVGSRAVVVASATGIAVGQWARIVADDAPTNDAFGYPCHWSKISGVAGTTISLDTPLHVTYSGTITFQAYNTSNIIPYVRFKNVTFDGSQSTFNGATGVAMRLSGVEEVDIDAKFKDWTTNNSSDTILEIFICIDARVRIRSINHLSETNHVDIQDCRTAHFYDSILEGQCFGVNITRCGFARAINNTLIGRRKKESDLATSPTHSIRGIKMYGCGDAQIIGNKSVDFESPIKVEVCHQFQIVGNVVRNAGLATYTGQIALNVGSITDGSTMRNGVISNNVVVNCGGSGIGVSTDTANNFGKVIITGNQVKGCGAIGIYCPVQNAVISNNRVEDWNTTAGSFNAIYYGLGATVTSNRFSNSVDTSVPCLNTNFTSGFKYTFRDNAVESANPMFSGPKNTMDQGTATIPSGSTNVTVSHGLIKAPAAYEISLIPTENATNDPGTLWVSGITSTQFVINCRADPGASNLDVAWRADLIMPFAA